ncbi:hypothetical protein E1B28_005529 [Marasmius oreades]|uniref:Uncharacterized protein n=1 Tax=Marasmius oreades TaxID=181124 RepID=A0A9P7S3E8_9AGAR|nr:uncharacterized protein E1B28_005529 [Marasmius oreades]KAG7094709.1 hypothetical protein E1B28_005529 [Marasmius oreades]
MNDNVHHLYALLMIGLDSPFSTAMADSMDIDSPTFASVVQDVNPMSTEFQSRIQGATFDTDSDADGDEDSVCFEDFDMDSEVRYEGFSAANASDMEVD